MPMNPRFCFAALFLAAFATQPVFAAQEMLLRERCHQGECTFTKIIQTKRIKSNAGGYLLEVKARSATVREKNDSRGEPRLPKNFGFVRVTYMYCSKEKPALIFSDSKFYAHLLKIGETPAGYEIDSQIEYWAACENKVVNVGDLMEGKLAKDAADLGYGKFPDNWGKQREFRNRKKAFQYFGF
jgi:hypothetical protein